MLAHGEGVLLNVLGIVRGCPKFAVEASAASQKRSAL